ncbi:MAG: GDSL-type esterase/lipase family protein [Solirubrobacteraceae bacterium]
MPDELIAPISPRTRRRGAREALIAIAVAAVVLVVAQGPSIERTGERLDPGPIRTGVLAVGRPAAWLGERLPVADAVHELTAGLSPDADLTTAPGGFDATIAGADRVQPVTADAFTPADLGGRPAPARGLRTLLVTGDSMAQPLDTVLARRLSGADATQVVRDVHVGTGISKSELLDWGKLSVRQTAEQTPDAVVVFIGANEGFAIDGVDCCGADWAAAYATRARTMMNTYRRDGDAVVYWLTLPLPRDKDRQEIARSVNAAVRAAATAYRSQVRVLDMTTLFTPGGEYRDDMSVEGSLQLVRDADGIHLNETGAELAADTVLEAVAQDFQSAP